jgi:uncharacterized protein YPO0396
MATEQALVGAIATENAENGANALATANAQATEVAEIAAVATQNAESGANELATAQAQAAAAQATVEALQQSQSVSDAQIATAQAQAAAVQSTIEALSTAQVASAATATVLAQQARNNSIQQQPVEESIQVDADGILNDDEDAQNDAIDQLHDVLDKYDGCRVGVTFTAGWTGAGGDVNEGQALADKINSLVRDEFPGLFGKSAFDSIANLNDPRGQVDIRMYFFTGCAEAQT